MDITRNAVLRFGASVLVAAVAATGTVGTAMAVPSLAGGSMSARDAWPGCTQRWQSKDHKYVFVKNVSCGRLISVNVVTGDPWFPRNNHNQCRGVRPGKTTRYGIPMAEQYLYAELWRTC